MKKIILPILLIAGIGVSAQKKDSITEIKGVTLSGFIKQKIKTDEKFNCSIDEYLASSDNVSFVKRGAYAWEPMLNNMSSERSVVTIEGMHIFGACTDKMDPVTSYVETNNLSRVDIQSGQEGNLHGATISGAIDLKRRRTIFSDDNKFGGAYQTGVEFNNRQFFNLGELYFSSPEWVADGTFSYRTADNYKDGRNREIKHSQYKKFNTSLGVGYKTGEYSSVKLDAIFDVAKDVGYPALPMDTWLARALITSASYKQLYDDSLIRVWDTKFYFNAIEHYMDDTTRPENPVHMDMPGWSTTYGLLSKIHLRRNSFSSDIQLNAYANESTAEMTMYPQDRSKKTMFAFTWPEVTTQYAGISMNSQVDLSDRSLFIFGGSAGWHYNYSKYVDFNWILYPGASQSKTRFLPSLHSSYQIEFSPVTLSAGVGYGHRAPSVSEGYGYYIFNSFDRYDYIGNPDLKNEISHEVNFSASLKTDKLIVEGKANYFHIKNYIIGKILNIGFPMNPLSVGVKGYTTLDYATLMNLSLNFVYNPYSDWQWKGSINYAKGQDYKKGNLPFIRPLSYQTSIRFKKNRFSCLASINGDFEQKNFSSEYGEDRTSAYIIYNLSADYTLPIGKNKLQMQVGAENLLNTFYTTYADWGNIPRMGRNIYIGTKFSF